MYGIGESGETLRVRRYHNSKMVVSKHIIAVVDIMRSFTGNPPYSIRPYCRAAGASRSEWSGHQPILVGQAGVSEQMLELLDICSSTAFPRVVSRR
jgi:hypothetical protein